MGIYIYVCTTCTMYDVHLVHFVRETSGDERERERGEREGSASKYTHTYILYYCTCTICAQSLARPVVTADPSGVYLPHRTARPLVGEQAMEMTRVLQQSGQQRERRKRQDCPTNVGLERSSCLRALRVHSEQPGKQQSAPPATERNRRGNWGLGRDVQRNQGWHRHRRRPLGVPGGCSRGPCRALSLRPTILFVVVVGVLLLQLDRSSSIDADHRRSQEPAHTVETLRLGASELRFAHARHQAGPNDDLEAEISRLEVLLSAEPGNCLVTGQQRMSYFFLNGRFNEMSLELGDDTPGIQFFTKRILSLNSSDYNSTALVTKKRWTTKCRSMLEWEVPEIVATDANPQVRNFRVDFEMSMGTVVNETHRFNEIVYSTGFHNRIAIKEIRVRINLPSRYPSEEVELVGNSGVDPRGGSYDEETGVATFLRETYLAPANRYTVRVWFPVETQTHACRSCEAVDEWIMFIILVPFLLCFIVPLCIHCCPWKKKKPPSTDSGAGESGFSTPGHALGGQQDGRPGASASDGDGSSCCCCLSGRTGHPGQGNGGRPVTAEYSAMTNEGSSI